MRSISIRIIMATAMLAAFCNASHAQPRPYVLEGTEVHSILSKILSRDYEIFVSLPESYASSQKPYPVLFITDANYAFPVVAMTRGLSWAFGKM
jgi:uncharacterized protein